MSDHSADLGAPGRRRAFAPEELVTVQARISTPLAEAEIARVHLPRPIDHELIGAPGYRLDMSLTGRPGRSRARYGRHWKPYQFEEIGEVFLLRGDEEIHATSDAGTAVGAICHLHPDGVRRWFGDELEWTDHRLRGSLDIRNVSIKSLLARMAHELREPGFASEIFIELIAGQLAIELRRWCTSLAEEHHIGGLAPWRLRLIDDSLAENAATVSVENLARLCRLSPRQLTRAFQSSKGCSLGKYIGEARIMQAKHMLSAGMTAKEVAAAIGFATQSSFAFAFRRATGQTPTEFVLTLR